jgi:hypothetical protein
MAEQKVIDKAKAWADKEYDELRYSKCEKKHFVFTFRELREMGKQAFIAGYEAALEAGKQREKTHQNCKHYHGDVVTAFEDKDYDNPCLTCFKFDQWEAAK